MCFYFPEKELYERVKSVEFKIFSKTWVYFITSLHESVSKGTVPQNSPKYSPKPCIHKKKCKKKKSRSQ